MRIRVLQQEIGPRTQDYNQKLYASLIHAPAMEPIQPARSPVQIAPVRLPAPLETRVAESGVVYERTRGALPVTMRVAPTAAPQTEGAWAHLGWAVAPEEREAVANQLVSGLVGDWSGWELLGEEPIPAVRTRRGYLLAPDGPPPATLADAYEELTRYDAPGPGSAPAGALRRALTVALEPYLPAGAPLDRTGLMSHEEIAEAIRRVESIINDPNASFATRMAAIQARDQALEQILELGPAHVVEVWERTAPEPSDPLAGFAAAPGLPGHKATMQTLQALSAIRQIQRSGTSDPDQIADALWRQYAANVENYHALYRKEKLAIDPDEADETPIGSVAGEIDSLNQQAPLFDYAVRTALRDAAQRRALIAREGEPAARPGLPDTDFLATGRVLYERLDEAERARVDQWLRALNLVEPSEPGATEAQMLDTIRSLAYFTRSRPITATEQESRPFETLDPQGRPIVVEPAQPAARTVRRHEDSLTERLVSQAMVDPMLRLELVRAAMFEMFVAQRFPTVWEAMARANDFAEIWAQIGQAEAEETGTTDGTQADGTQADGTQADGTQAQQPQTPQEPEDELLRVWKEAIDRLEANPLDRALLLRSFTQDIAQRIAAALAELLFETNQARLVLAHEQNRATAQAEALIEQLSRRSAAQAALVRVALARWVNILAQSYYEHRLGEYARPAARYEETSLLRSGGYEYQIAALDTIVDATEARAFTKRWEESSHSDLARLAHKLALAYQSEIGMLSEDRAGESYERQADRYVARTLNTAPQVVQQLIHAIGNTQALTEQNFIGEWTGDSGRNAARVQAVNALVETLTDPGAVLEDPALSEFLKQLDAQTISKLVRFDFSDLISDKNSVRTLIQARTLILAIAALVNHSLMGNGFAQSVFGSELGQINLINHIMSNDLNTHLASDPLFQLLVGDTAVLLLLAPSLVRAVIKASNLSNAPERADNEIRRAFVLPSANEQGVEQALGELNHETLGNLIESFGAAWRPTFSLALRFTMARYLYGFGLAHWIRLNKGNAPVAQHRQTLIAAASLNKPDALRAFLTQLDTVIAPLEVKLVWHETFTRDMLHESTFDSVGEPTVGQQNVWNVYVQRFSSALQERVGDVDYALGFDPGRFGLQNEEGDFIDYNTLGNQMRVLIDQIETFLYIHLHAFHRAILDRSALVTESESSIYASQEVIDRLSVEAVVESLWDATQIAQALRGLAPTAARRYAHRLLSRADRYHWNVVLWAPHSYYEQARKRATTIGPMVSRINEYNKRVQERQTAGYVPERTVLMIAQSYNDRLLRHGIADVSTSVVETTPTLSKAGVLSSSPMLYWVWRDLAPDDRGQKPFGVDRSPIVEGRPEAPARVRLVEQSIHTDYFETGEDQKRRRVGYATTHQLQVGYQSVQAALWMAALDNIRAGVDHIVNAALSSQAALASSVERTLGIDPVQNTVAGVNAPFAAQTVLFPIAVNYGISDLRMVEDPLLIPSEGAMGRLFRLRLVGEDGAVWLGEPDEAAPLSTAQTAPLPTTPGYQAVRNVKYRGQADTLSAKTWDAILKRFGDGAGVYWTVRIEELKEQIEQTNETLKQTLESAAQANTDATIQIKDEMGIRTATVVARYVQALQATGQLSETEGDVRVHFLDPGRPDFVMLTPPRVVIHNRVTVTNDSIELRREFALQLPVAYVFYTREGEPRVDVIYETRPIRLVTEQAPSASYTVRFPFSRDPRDSWRRRQALYALLRASDQSESEGQVRLSTMPILPVNHEAARTDEHYLVAMMETAHGMIERMYRSERGVRRSVRLPVDMAVYADYHVAGDQNKSAPVRIMEMIQATGRDLHYSVMRNNHYEMMRLIHRLRTLAAYGSAAASVSSRYELRRTPGVLPSESIRWTITLESEPQPGGPVRSAKIGALGPATIRSTGAPTSGPTEQEHTKIHLAVEQPAERGYWLMPSMELVTEPGEAPIKAGAASGPTARSAHATYLTESLATLADVGPLQAAYMKFYHHAQLMLRAAYESDVSRPEALRDELTLAGDVADRTLESVASDAQPFWVNLKAAIATRLEQQARAGVRHNWATIAQLFDQGRYKALAESLRRYPDRPLDEPRKNQLIEAMAHIAIELTVYRAVNDALHDFVRGVSDPKLDREAADEALGVQAKRTALRSPQILQVKQRMDQARPEPLEGFAALLYEMVRRAATGEGYLTGLATSVSVRPVPLAALLNATLRKRTTSAQALESEASVEPAPGTAMKAELNFQLNGLHNAFFNLLERLNAFPWLGSEPELRDQLLDGIEQLARRTIELNRALYPESELSPSDLAAIRKGAPSYALAIASAQVETTVQEMLTRAVAPLVGATEPAVDWQRVRQVNAAAQLAQEIVQQLKAGVEAEPPSMSAQQLGNRLILAIKDATEGIDQIAAQQRQIDRLVAQIRTVPEPAGPASGADSIGPLELAALHVLFGAVTGELQTTPVATRPVESAPSLVESGEPGAPAETNAPTNAPPTQGVRRPADQYERFNQLVKSLEKHEAASQWEITSDPEAATIQVVSTLNMAAGDDDISFRSTVQIDLSRVESLESIGAKDLATLIVQQRNQLLGDRKAKTVTKTIEVGIFAGAKLTISLEPVESSSGAQPTDENASEGS